MHAIAAAAAASTRAHLPAVNAADIMSQPYRLVVSPGEEVVTVVHVGTDDVGKCSQAVLGAKFRPPGKELKARTPKVAPEFPII